jgi:hypothetical protein
MNNWKCYDDSSTRSELPPNDLYILLFKRDIVPQIYQNVILNISQINEIILYNFDIFINTLDNYYPLYDKNEKIIFYIRILVYYTSLYNQKSNKNYKVTLDYLILSIINKLKEKLKILLI